MMALWVKPDGQIVCAAFNEPENGDVYIDDQVHGLLYESRIIWTNDEGDTWQTNRDPKQLALIMR